MRSTKILTIAVAPLLASTFFCGTSSVFAQFESSQAATSESGDIYQTIINEGNAVSSASSASSSSSSGDHGSKKGLTVFVEFTNRYIYTDARVRVSGIAQSIDLTQNSYVKFTNLNIPVGDSFNVNVEAWNNDNDRRHLTLSGYNGPEKEPERFYVDLR